MQITLLTVATLSMLAVNLALWPAVLRGTTPADWKRIIRWNLTGKE